MNKLPVFELVIDESIDNDQEVKFVALVDKPAIKKNFLTFKEDNEIHKKEFKFQIQSEEERIVTGPLMLADELIYRNQDGNEYNVYFSKDTIKKIVQKFFQKKFINNVNLMHDKDYIVDNVYMFESWIVDNERGTKPLKGFEDVPDGSWFGSYKVDNDEVWNMIKSGTFKGFSVEGVFDYKHISKEEMQMREIISILQDISLC